VRQGTEVSPQHTDSIPTSHTFALSAKKLLCREVLYVSDNVCEPHYQLSHPKNEGKKIAGLNMVVADPALSGAEIAGEVVVDMTFLKTERRLQPVGPYPDSKSGRRFYDVEFDLVIKVDGRNLKFEARWPRRKEGENALGQVQASGQIAIAAAFLPGTE
jgi:hypothetical protein